MDRAFFEVEVSRRKTDRSDAEPGIWRLAGISMSKTKSPEFSSGKSVSSTFLMKAQNSEFPCFLRDGSIPHREKKAGRR
jgi:hypothetical protein